MTRVIVVEYVFDPPIEDETRVAFDRKLAPCLEVREARVRATYLSADRRRRIALVEAADAEAVRYAHRSAGVPFAGVWPADQE